MKAYDTNEQGCPLNNQTGRDAIKDFDAILARLSPDQRRAFERERAERLADLWATLTPPRYGYGV